MKKLIKLYQEGSKISDILEKLELNGPKTWKALLFAFNDACYRRTFCVDYFLVLLYLFQSDAVFLDIIGADQPADCDWIWFIGGHLC